MNVMEVMKYLGGAAIFGRAPRSVLELEAQLRDGLPVRSLFKFKERARLSNDELASIADLSPKTLQRYFNPGAKSNASKNMRVAVGPSDRVFRAAEVMTLADEVFAGDQGAARDWLRSEQFGLGGRVPLDLLRTSLGAQLVEDQLKRMQHGFLA